MWFLKVRIVILSKELDMPSLKTVELDKKAFQIKEDTIVKSPNHPHP